MSPGSRHIVLWHVMNNVLLQGAFMVTKLASEVWAGVGASSQGAAAGIQQLYNVFQMSVLLTKSSDLLRQGRVWSGSIGMYKQLVVTWGVASLLHVLSGEHARYSDREGTLEGKLRWP